MNHQHRQHIQQTSSAQTSKFTNHPTRSTGTEEQHRSKNSKPPEKGNVLRLIKPVTTLRNEQTAQVHQMS
jgi:hypothetical protein